MLISKYESFLKFENGKKKLTLVHHLVAPKHIDPFVDLHTYTVESAAPQFPPTPLCKRRDL